MQGKVENIEQSLLKIALSAMGLADDVIENQPAKSMVDKSRAELSHLEQAVADQMNTQSNKKKNTSKKSATAAATPGGDDGLLAGISADLDLDFELSDDSD